MKMTIQLNDTIGISRFVLIASQASGPVQLHSGRFTVDGKSIMGVLSLDHSTSVTVEYEDGDEPVLSGLRLFEVPADMSTYHCCGGTACR